MKYLVITCFVLLAISCAPQKEGKADGNYKIPVYGWMGGPGDATDEAIKAQFEDFKKKGIDGLMYNGGQNPETYKRVGKIAKDAGLEFHTWIPTMVQKPSEKLKKELFAINSNGESAFDKPDYVSYYNFLCPSREEVFEFLAEMCAAVADVE